MKDFLWIILSTCSLVEAPWPFPPKRETGGDETKLPRPPPTFNIRPPMPGRYPSEIYTPTVPQPKIPLPHQITDSDIYLAAGPVQPFVRSTSRASRSSRRFPVRPSLRSTQSEPGSVPQIILTKICCRCNRHIQLDTIACPICNELRHILCHSHHTETDFQHYQNAVEIGKSHRLEDITKELDEIIDLYSPERQ